jgi:hypothetical protein
MNPQGQFQSVTWFPNQSTLKLSWDFPVLTAIQVPNSLLPILHHPREWTSTLLCQAVPQEILLLLGLQCNWSRISMLELSGLAVVNKDGHRPTHIRHVGLKSWLYYTNDHYNQ